MVIQPEQFGQLEIPYDKVLSRLGFARGKTQIDEKTSRLISEEITVSKKLLAPRQVVSSAKVILPSGGRVYLEPGLTIVSQKIYELLKPCTAAYGFAVTIGRHIEDKRNKYIEAKETTRALILDAIGSVMTEDLADITNRQIKDEAQKSGFGATIRFSPGYGDWELAGQKDFLEWLSAKDIGIRLSDNYQMIPEKSVSAILGVFHEQK